jgi:hypothetical protein
MSSNANALCRINALTVPANESPNLSRSKTNARTTLCDLGECFVRNLSKAVRANVDRLWRFEGKAVGNSELGGYSWAFKVMSVAVAPGGDSGNPQYFHLLDFAISSRSGNTSNEANTDAGIFLEMKRSRCTGPRANHNACTASIRSRY